MDIRKFDFKAENKEAYFRTNKELLDDAIAKGFYNGKTKFNKMFSDLFYDGGQLPLKKDLPEKFKKDCVAYLKSFMQSFEPKHEEKDAISALLLSELCI